MEPRLADNDHLIVNKLLYQLDGLPTATLGLGRPPRRGDVVIADNPVGAGGAMIKRVVGCPNERVHVDELGRVSIDGTPLDEPIVRLKRACFS